MFYIYGALIIVIIHLSYIISYEKSTWYQSRTRLDSLTGGPKKMKENGLLWRIIQEEYETFVLRICMKIIFV
jgi:hypothetical protein